MANAKTCELRGEFLSGGTPNRASAEYWNGSIPWISAKSLKSFYVTDSEERVTQAGVEHGTRAVPAGTLLFVVRGMSLAKEFRVGVASRALAFNQDLRALIPSLDIDPIYLVHFLRGAEAEILGLVDHASHGTTRLTSDRIEAVEVPLPPLAEQRRIAEVLDRAETLRAKRRAALAQLDTLTQALFLDLFGDPATILGKWPTEKLGKILDFLTSGSRGWAAHYADSGDLFLRIQNVRYDELVLDDIAYVDAPDTAEAKRTRVQPGDVLLSITADLGRTAVVPEGLGVPQAQADDVQSC